MANPDNESRGGSKSARTPERGEAERAGIEQGGGSDENPIRDTTDRLMEEGRSRARGALDSQKHRAAEGLDQVADALHDVADDMDDREIGIAARYANRAATRVEDWARRVRDRDIDDVLGEAESYARRQPEVFVGGAFLIGFLMARIAKASSDRRRARAVGTGMPTNRGTAHRAGAEVWEGASGYGRSGYGSEPYATPGAGYGTQERYPGAMPAATRSDMGRDTDSTGASLDRSRFTDEDERVPGLGVQGSATGTSGRATASEATGISTSGTAPAGDGNERFSGPGTITGDAAGGTGHAPVSGNTMGGGTAGRVSGPIVAGGGGTSPGGGQGGGQGGSTGGTPTNVPASGSGHTPLPGTGATAQAAREQQAARDEAQRNQTSRASGAPTQAVPGQSGGSRQTQSDVKPTDIKGSDKTTVRRS